MQRPPELQSVMAGIPGLAGATMLQALGSGGASDSWLVEAGGRKLVVRVDTPLAQTLGLDRRRELKVLETVSREGIGPDVVWADAAAGVLVTAFVPGPVWEEKDVQKPAFLRQLAGTLKRLHRLPFAGPLFDPARAAQAYAASVGTRSAAELAARISTLARQLLTPADPCSLCHNDLVYTNILGFGPVRLIDWEYAAVGDPLFDLAVVVRHHQLKTELATGFLQACLGHVDAHVSERFDAFCGLYDLLAKLWYMAVGSHASTARG